jgi:hypothetical protein
MTMEKTFSPRRAELPAQKAMPPILDEDTEKLMPANALLLSAGPIKSLGSTFLAQMIDIQLAPQRPTGALPIVSFAVV